MESTCAGVWSRAAGARSRRSASAPSISSPRRFARLAYSSSARWDSSAGGIRRSARQGEAALALRPDHPQHHGGETALALRLGGLQQRVVEQLQQPPGVRLHPVQRLQALAELAGADGRLDALAGDVAEEELRTAVGQPVRAVEVPADAQAGLGRSIGGAPLHPGGLGRLHRHQARLKVSATSAWSRLSSAVASAAPARAAKARTSSVSASSYQRVARRATSSTPTGASRPGSGTTRAQPSAAVRPGSQPAVTACSTTSPRSPYAGAPAPPRDDHGAQRRVRTRRHPSGIVTIPIAPARSAGCGKALSCCPMGGHPRRLR